MITVNAIKYREAREDAVAENYGQSYRDREGLVRIETCSFQSTSDFSDGKKQRISEDNGKTWGEWEDVYEQSGYEVYGPHERNYPKNIRGVWNPVHKHFVGVGMSRFFENGHIEAYKKFWGGDHTSLADHAHIGVREDGGTSRNTLVKYEEGADFDPADPLNPEHFYKNNGFPGTNVVIDDNGDILFALGVPVYKCCEIAGVDVSEHFPSSPYLLRNMIVIRGVWNGETYDCIPSRPILISDLKSSRGVDEPTIMKLKSGRIVVVFRGSNVTSKSWRTRIEPGTPGFKWYCWSDDGGKTFTDPVPWHFDDGEVIYSSATISRFIRDERNGRLYWIGNITDHKVNGNFPRWPLCIVEVDETYGLAKKESFTIIDTKREGESDRVQLSNFGLLQDRETGKLELRLTKYGQFDGQPTFQSESWMYEITLPEE